MLNFASVLLLIIFNIAHSSDGVGLEFEKNELIYVLGNYAEIEIGTNGIVKQGTNVTINCNINASNTTDYVWKLNRNRIIFDNDSFIANQPYIQISQYRNGEIVIRNISKALTGEYTCVSRTQTGVEQTNISLLQIRNCPQHCIGKNGNKGVKGVRGDEGLRGYSGNEGNCYNGQCLPIYMKLQSKQGLQGIKGVMGEMGKNGGKGLEGIIKGSNGENGLKGTNGERGNRGEQGSNGAKGKRGDQGEQGAKGERGTEGLMGLNGANGTKGEKGEPSIPLIGTKGEKGENGSNGEIGKQGEKGIQGDNGSIGEKGIRGEKGETGAKGVNGTKGDRGIDILILNVSSNVNSNCRDNYEVGQIVYDTAIDEFIYCNGIKFICIKHRSCFPSNFPPELSFEVRNTIIDVTENSVYEIGPVMERKDVSRISLFSIQNEDTSFTLKSSLINGSLPINVEWYYKESENSSNRTVLNGNPTGITELLIFRLARHSWSEGFYYLNVSNQFGYDYQVAKVGIRPIWIENIECVNECFGKNVVAIESTEVRLNANVSRETKLFEIKYFLGGNLVAEYSSLTGIKISQTNYNLTVDQNVFTLIILKYNDSYSGNYVASVENEFGTDSIRSYISTKIVVNCNPGSVTDTEQEPCVCTHDSDNNQLLYTLYGHSFPIGSQIHWIVTDSEGNGITELTKTVKISNKMNFNLLYAQYCNNSVSAVVREGDKEQIFKFSCNCTQDCGDQKCCEKHNNLIRQSCRDGKAFANIYVLIDISNSMVGKHDFLNKFLPELEKSLTNNCIGKNEDSNKRNHYITIAFGGENTNERDGYAFFIGPEFDYSQTEASLPFFIDPQCESGVEAACNNVNSLVNRLSTKGQKADGYAATKFASLNYLKGRENGELPTNLLILVSNGIREYEGTFEELLMRTLYNREDEGNNKYINFLRNTLEAIPVNLVNTALKAKPNSQEVECIGVTSFRKCLYLSNNNISETYENVYVDTTEPEAIAKENIRKNYVQTALKAGGYAFNLETIISDPNARRAAIQTLVKNEFSNSLQEKLGCQQCSCVFGNRAINCTPLDALEQDMCVCLQTNNNKKDYCNCVMAVKDVQKCDCLHIANQSEDACVITRDLPINIE